MSIEIPGESTSSGRHEDMEETKDYWWGIGWYKNFIGLTDW